LELRSFILLEYLTHNLNQLFLHIFPYSDKNIINGHKTQKGTTRLFKTYTGKV